MSLNHLSDVEHVRERPGMYIGSRGFFGLVHYLVDATNLILQHRPTKLAISTDGSEFTFGSDTTIPMSRNATGKIFPFEVFKKDGNAKVSHGPLLTALSESFSYSERHSRTNYFSSRNGVRDDEAPRECPEEYASFIRFAPDRTIFDCLSISDYVFKSYLKRMSFLFPKVTFRFDYDGNAQEFYSERGIPDMFDGLAGPFQLLHEPIQLSATKEDLQLSLSLHFTVGGRTGAGRS